MDSTITPWMVAALALGLIACAPEPDALAVGECEAPESPEVELARDLEIALAEIAHHGAILSRFTYEARHSPFQTLIANRPGPGEFVDLYDGWYVRVTDNGHSRAQLSARLRAGRDYGFASAGETVRASLFADQSYLIDAHASSDLAYTTLYFSERGRLAELLGLGYFYTSPVTLDHEEAQGLNDGIAELELTATLEVDKEFASGVRVSYVVEFSPTRTDAFDQPIDLTLVEFEVSDTDGRVLVVKDWDMRYELGALEGTLEFEIRGGDSTYSGVVSDGELEVSCG